MNDDPTTTDPTEAQPAPALTRIGAPTEVVQHRLAHLRAARWNHAIALAELDAQIAALVALLPGEG